MLVVYHYSWYDYHSCTIEDASYPLPSPLAFSIQIGVSLQAFKGVGLKGIGVLSALLLFLCVCVCVCMATKRYLIVIS